MQTERLTGGGALLFARYAHPPNLLGYCGPADHLEFFEQATEGVVDRGLHELTHAFDGAWPYLELIASANGIRDPLDHAVVHAYWIGNPLLERVDLSALGGSVEARFRRRVGRGWDHLSTAILAGAVPHHSFHVLLVSPWIGLMRAGASAHPLHVMDRCRIRTGRVIEVTGDVATVDVPALRWDGRELRVGSADPELATVKTDGRGFLPDLRPGDLVSLHWDWVCDLLSAREARSLDGYTARHLSLANARTSVIPR
ncbi:MAG TPA: DUF6390 family protein [Actinomycetota bacterium]